ncbi:MAG: aminotransferase class III-fold pyridoxal phosphate-dependent enzyme [Nannocystaceae bacterium]
MKPCDAWQRQQRDHLFFTWSRQAGQRGFEIADAEGARFRVPDKGWIWDLESQVYNVGVGHKHPHVRQRMIEQIERLPACAPNVLLPIRAELAQKLAQHTGLQRSFLTTGGSEAVENAIKIARLVTRRRKVVTRRRSYHGATLAVLAISGDARGEPFARAEDPRCTFDDPYPVREATGNRPSDWLENLQRRIEIEGPETIAAILLEGFTGTNGMQIPPIDFWRGARELCDLHGILLIDDEIFSGFGRTGTWFAREHWDVRADMMVVGKAITSGCAPLAGVVVSQSIAEHFDDETLWCGLTHYAHPVSCAAAMGSIEVLERDDLVQNSRTVGDHLRERLGELQRDPLVGPHITDVRGLGLMITLEFDRNSRALAEILWHRNVYAPTRGRCLYICPPLCLSQTEADTIADLIADASHEFIRS